MVVPPSGMDGSCQNPPYQRGKAPHRRWGSVGSCRPSRPQGHPPAPPEGVKNSKPVGMGEGEAPAEPHWSINFENRGSPGGSRPPNFFHTFPSKGEWVRFSGSAAPKYFTRGYSH
ncbi:MAG: hypothetical protein DMG05_08020 [Acidobacteria bacterium]|nr:MAG: hypothetical protein DMG05_08020 [Acidobacteriota bacterium]